MVTADPLAAIRAFDRLVIGPVKLEPQRLVMPYVIHRGGERHETELIYRYEEPVFDPADPTDVNLASMIGAQVALNYGLFCDELVFRGPFARADRELLREMAANTAREIYVKKFLEPNPFLVGEARELPVVVQDSYLRARLVFEDRAPPVLPHQAWRRDHEQVRVAVLSSGGKDSLLSHGLLEELGYEVHALFVNESGRHWYTALNGYRYLAASRGGTARVWSNCDRLFGWMLKQLPFIRQDHARVRADEYPVRLWTVAVFLFGTLPLMRRRGLGMIVIGDEHDTSRRCEHRGIPHYDGLYDQSRWFDLRLSRYFAHKGWDVLQFSLLRNLSELLIQGALANRYPELFAHQVSCHAAHIEGERVLPCGRCEKCRRIVGMVTALGGDPRACGYTDAQIAQALEALAQHGAHQEGEGARQLGWMLQERGELPPDTPFARAAAHEPRVMQLRFDPELAPVDDMPTELRAGILRLLLEHAEGATRRKGDRWVPFDPLRAEVLTKPHPLERPDLTAQAPPPASTRDWVLGTMTWPQAQRRFAEVDVALLPVGAIEQHGPHLPLDTDAWDARRLAHDVAEACQRPRPLVLPLIPYGVSYHHADFAGTLAISPETLSRVVVDIGLAAASHGIRKLLIVNGHGGNIPALQFAAQVINRDAHIFTCVDTGETSDAEIARLIETKNDVHAGEYETSTSLALRPELVDMERAAAQVPHFSNRYLDFSSSVSVSWFARTSRISPTGVMGDPTKASAEKGRAMWAVMVRNLVELVETLKLTPLDQLYRRRE
jgi:creatinine amidohydrolase/Fe(II)-dependent formamide hydrolase-like protein